MRRRGLRIFGLFLLLATIGIASLAIGPVRLSAAAIVEALLGGQTGDRVNAAAIVWELRLPRITLAALVGLALGAAGAAYQGLFRNPLADPFVIGASSGSALGATLVIITAGNTSALGFSAVPLGGFVGAMGAAAIVYFSTAWWGQMPLVGLLLAGSAVSSCLGALVWLLMVLHDEDLAQIVAWLMGSLGGPWLGGRLWRRAVYRVWHRRALRTRASARRPVARRAAREIPGSSPDTRERYRGGGRQFSHGRRRRRIGRDRVCRVDCAHLARTCVGARHRYLIPASGLTGAILLLLADDLARTVAAPVELPVGVLTAILGGPFFLVVLGTRSR